MSKYYFIYLGRLDQTIHVPLPNGKSRTAILNVYLRRQRSVSQDINIQYWTNMTDGCSAVAIIKICQRAYQLARTEFIETKQQRIPHPTMDSDEPDSVLKVCQDHIIEALGFDPPSAGNNHISKNDNTSDDAEQLEEDEK